MIFQTLKNLALDLLKFVALYLLIVVGGLFVFLCLTPLIGYLPYSDRPGAGWKIKPLTIGWSDFWHGAQFMWEWLQLLLPNALVVGVLLFLGARLLERARTPRVLAAILSALPAGFMTGYVVAATGWYIALGGPAVYASMLLAMIFGVFVMPRRKQHAGAARVVPSPAGSRDALT